ncbi:penicillin-binding transpeptidase domain-containing protein [Streptomyces brevispora]|uniref:penicillin-binding transpeptidase domain-containing protein n=1 Tax=Streptomyces brevispora TaxID=887462 RepID=UPI0035E1677C
MTAPPGGSGARPVPVQVSVSMPLRYALTRSANLTFTRLGKHIGLKKVKKMAVAAGLREESLARLDKSFPLGTSTPSAVRMADAYTAFSNNGMRAEPYSVTGVTRDGETVKGFGKPEPQRAMNASVAHDVKDSLGIVAWTSLARDRKFDALADSRTLDDLSAGATHEDDRMRSAWFIGHAEGLTTAVTMFRNKPGTPQLLGMQGVGGDDSERGNVFPLRIWTTYATGK